MTDAEINKLYSQTLGFSHTAALRAIFTAGYAAHAGTSVGAADASKAASYPTSLPFGQFPRNDEHG